MIARCATPICKFRIIDIAALGAAPPAEWRGAVRTRRELVFVDLWVARVHADVGNGVCFRRSQAWDVRRRVDVRILRMRAPDDSPGNWGGTYACGCCAHGSGDVVIFLAEAAEVVAARGAFLCEGIFDGTLFLAYVALPESGGSLRCGRLSWCLGHDDELEYEVMTRILV